MGSNLSEIWQQMHVNLINACIDEEKKKSISGLSGDNLLLQ